MPDNNRTSQGKTRADGVHHSGPVAELGLFRRVASSEDESDGCWWQADDGAGDGTKDDAEADSERLFGC